MKKIGTLITHDGSDLPCVILPIRKSLFPFGKEVYVYCQNRLIRGYLQEEDDNLVAEIEVIIEFLIAPELEEFLKENSERKKILTEIYYV